MVGWALRAVTGEMSRVTGALSLRAVTVTVTVTVTCLLLSSPQVMDDSGGDETRCDLM